MYLLDTNVISEFRKVNAGRADENVAAFARGTRAGDSFLSVITLEELELGALLAARRDTVQGKSLRQWLHDRILSDYAQRILPVDTAVALRSADLHVPKTRPIRDAYIAATALVHGLTVVTRNVKDFEPTGVPVLNPWDPQ